MARKSYLRLLTLNTIAFLFLGAEASAQLEWREIYQTNDSLPFCNLFEICFLTPDTGLVGGHCPYSMYQTFDAGETWIPRWELGGEGLDNTSQIEFFNNRQGFITFGSTIALTFDAGESWEYNTAGELHLGDIVYRDAAHLVTAASYGGEWPDSTYDQINMSSDSGRTWTIVHEETHSPFDGLILGLTYSQSGTFVVGLETDRALRSTDGGYTWNTVYNVPIDLAYDGVSPTPGVFVLAGANYYNNGLLYPIIVRSDNDGIAWQVVWADSQASEDRDFIADIAFGDSLHGWATRRNHILMHTDDGGLTWDADTLNLPSGVGGVVFGGMDFLSPELGWLVATGVFGPSRILRYSEAQSSHEHRYPIHRTISVNPAFPNPFNSSITLTFDLTAESGVTVVVFDITGREVMKAALGLLAAGRHTHTIDAAGLPSGIYFARVEAAGIAKTVKIALIR
ncbi:T9SS type A sorting domain-containing protein [bacterium]|nr:T9SS type A sorting domain-containing protein [bacterium]